MSRSLAFSVPRRHAIRRDTRYARERLYANAPNFRWQNDERVHGFAIDAHEERHSLRHFVFRRDARWRATQRELIARTRPAGDADSH